MKLTQQSIILSVGIPIYNEQENIAEIFRRIQASLETSPYKNFEVIFIDNNSTDDSFNVLKKLFIANLNVRVIRHSRNYGYQSSIHTIMEHAIGDYLAIIDGDLQDPPEHIPKMLQKLISSNSNIIYGVRASRQEGVFQRFLYKAFYYTWRKMADIQVQTGAGEFAIYDKKSKEFLLSFNEQIRFHRGLRAYVGLNQIEYLYDRDSRELGYTKFSFKQQLQLAADAIYSFSFAPIRFIMKIGILVLFIAGIFVLISIYFKISSILSPTSAYPQMADGLVVVFVIVASLLGLILVMLGVIGEYVGRIYEEVRKRPKLLQDVLNH